MLVCDPPQQLAYSSHNEGNTGPHSRVSFTIEPHSGMVKLTLVHDELPDQQAARDFHAGCAPILSSLKMFLEPGKPLPQLRSFEEQGRVEG